MSRVFFLGCFERRVTFYAQQVRAINLASALLDEDVIRVNGRVAIVGGGLAGVTLSAYLAQFAPQLKIVLYERNSALLYLQRGARDRYVHPHIFDWPAPSASQKNAGLPMMDWTAGTAQGIVQAIDSQFEAVRRQGNIEVRLSTAVNGLTSFGDHAVGVSAGYTTEWERFDTAVLSIGFGLERGLHHQLNPSYWQPSVLSAPLLFTGPLPKIFISGNGDGALADFALAAFNHKPHGEIFELVLREPGLDVAAAQLLRIDERAWSDPGVDIFAAYETELTSLLPKHLLNNVADHLRPDAFVVLHTTETALFRPETAIINRFIAFLIILADRAFKRGRVEVHVGRAFLSPPQSSPQISIEGVAPFAPEVRLLRFGPDRDEVMKDFCAMANAFCAIHPVTKVRSREPSMTISAQQRLASIAPPATAPAPASATIALSGTSATPTGATINNIQGGVAAGATVVQVYGGSPDRR